MPAVAAERRKLPWVDLTPKARDEQDLPWPMA
jgi:predicted dithiol-disulfide oxidoreductase (DUF899 family)